MNEEQLLAFRKALKADEVDVMTDEEALVAAGKAIMDQGSFLHADSPKVLDTPDGRTCVSVRIWYAAPDGMKSLLLRGPWR